MSTYRANGIRILTGLLSLWSACLHQAPASTVLPAPILRIGLVSETSAAITFSPLRWASRPVLVDVRTQTVFVGSGGCEFAASVVCSNQPVLTLEVLVPSGHTNEVEWTTDLVNWTPSNVRWVSDGSPVRYYVPQPVEGQFYRVRYSNTAPTAALAVSPLATLPGVTNLLVISANRSDAMVVLDGSQSSDAENDPLQYAWSEETNVFATTVTTARRLELGHHAITLQVSDGLATASASAPLDTIKASAAVEILIVLVSSDEGGIGVPRNRHPVLATLTAAAASFDRGDLASGVNQLQAFQQQAWVQWVSFDEGNTNFIQAAEEIVRAVSR